MNYNQTLSAILACIGSALLGAAFGTWEARRDAIRAGVAYYSVNPTNGEVQFRYRVCIDPEEVLRKLRGSVSPVLTNYP